MKTFVCLTLFLTSLTVALAQPEFKQEWKKTFPVDPKWKLINDDASLILAGDLSQVAMIDGASGEPLWQLNFKEKFNVKSSSDWNWHKDDGTVWVSFKEGKGAEKVYYFDERSGEQIDEATYEKRKASGKKAGKRVANYENFVIPDKDVTVTVSYENKARAAFNSKGTEPITVKSTGGHNWTQTIQGSLVRNLCAGFAGSSSKFGDVYLDLFYNDNKLFVMYEGLSVLDIATGKELWKTSFDNSENDFKLFKMTQTLGRGAFPVQQGEVIYLADLSKDQYRIKSFDVNSGKLLWESEKYDGETVITRLSVAGNSLVATFGGMVEVQSYIPGQNGNPDVCRSEALFKGKFGLKAYDRSTGKLLWETSAMKELGDKFSSAITNPVVVGNLVFTCSDKNCYAFDAATGKVEMKVAEKEMKVGQPESLFMYEGKIIVEATEGVAAVDPSAKSLLYASNTGKRLRSFIEGGSAYYVWTGKEKNDLKNFARVDLSSGKVLGKISDTYYPYFSADGNAFIKFDGKNLFRYITN